jgi:C4-dicarboxylate-specific signal transduction histidine kinase
LPKESLAWVLIQQPQINEADARQSFGLVEEVATAYGKEVPIRIRELQGCVLAANGRFPEAIAMAEKTRWVFDQNKDKRAVARLDAQIAKFKAGQRWIPGKKS